ncbi:MAG: flap endonuclease [Gammaproteobacteria bacterium]|nr:flap endonuclease [Gammaproteobacteria bacterium]
MSKEPIHLVDGSIYFFRALFGVPDLFFDGAGKAVNGVKGYLHFLFGLVHDQDARYLVVAFDESLTSCFRNDLYPAYKAHRPLPDENIKYQFKLCQRLTASLGVLTLAHPRFEADDIMATVAARARRPVRLLSRDKDLLQLLRPGVTLASPVSGVATESQFHAQFGFPPALYPDYQALQGDSVDNIPGVPGVGPKTAARLVARFGGLEAIYANRSGWPEVGVGAQSRVAQRLLAHRADAMLFRQLTRLHRRAPVRYPASATRVGSGSLDGLRRGIERAGLLRHFAGPLARVASG